MIAITVDDEQLMLKTLTNAVAASPDITDVHAFSTCSAAIQFAEEHHIDAAFLDIKMRGMGGLALAEKIVDLCPGCKIVFCTGYDEYALEAIQLRCSGYLMKPITVEAVQKEIDYILSQQINDKLLTVKCFGLFDILYRGKAVPFKRKKTKELVAVLVDRCGSRISGRQICSIMWPEDSNDEKNMDYLRHLVSDLKSSLKEIGASSVFQQDTSEYRIDTDQISCDYIDYLEKGSPKFCGEYMSQYSWAEVTCAMLNRMQQE